MINPNTPSDDAADQAAPLPDDMAALEEAVKAAGGFGALANLIGVAASSPSMWRKRGAVPFEQGPDIELAVGGKVTVDRLCPNHKWVRIKDAAWPHPDGRPLPDMARLAPPSPEQPRQVA